MVKALLVLCPLLWLAGFWIVPDPGFYGLLSALIVGFLVVLGLIAVWRAPDTRAALRDLMARIFE